MNASTSSAQPTREATLTGEPELDVSAVRAEPRQSHVQRRGIVYLQVLMLVAALVAWEWVAWAFKTDFWTSSPSAVLDAMVKWYESDQLLGDLKITLFEAGVGFVLGSVTGGLVGFVLGWVKKLGDLFEPFILSLYTLPKIALAPLFVLWFGIGVSN